MDNVIENWDYIMAKEVIINESFDISIGDKFNKLKEKIIELFNKIKNKFKDLITPDTKLIEKYKDDILDKLKRNYQLTAKVSNWHSIDFNKAVDEELDRIDTTIKLFQYLYSSKTVNIKEFMIKIDNSIGDSSKIVHRLRCAYGIDEKVEMIVDEFFYRQLEICKFEANNIETTKGKILSVIDGIKERIQTDDIFKQNSNKITFMLNKMVSNTVTVFSSILQIYNAYRKEITSVLLKVHNTKM